MQALVLDAEARTAIVDSVPRPSPAAGEILVKVEAVSLNPVDPLYVGRPLGRTGRIVGCDFAGTVVEKGQDTGKVQIGEKVAGFVQGACSVNDRPGAFAEYVAIPYDLVWRVPDGISLEQASGVSLCALTAAQVLWYRLGLSAPFEYDRTAVLEEHPEFRRSSDSSLDVTNIFVHSASTAIGLFAAQLLRIATKANGERVRLFGSASKTRWSGLYSGQYMYDHLVDYHEDDWPQQIKELSAGRGMHYVFDTITEGDSLRRCISVLGEDAKAMAVSRRPQDMSIDPAVPVIYGPAFEGLGETIHYDFDKIIPQSATARDFAVKFYDWLSMVAGSDFEPLPVRVMPGGLGRIVEDGFKLLGAGRMEDRDVTRTEEWMKPVSGEKLVYQI